MSVIRAFIAISLTTEITQNLENVLVDLKRRLPGPAVRWIQARNIHLTLKFLGDTPTTSLNQLTQALQDEVLKRSVFLMEVSGLGCFPPARKPRVVWVGVQAPPELGALQQGIETAMARLEFAVEERPFSPHLTLGRVGRDAKPADLARLSDVLTDYQLGLLGVCPVGAIHLYRSDLQPGGAVYTRLSTASLAGS